MEIGGGGSILSLIITISMIKLNSDYANLVE